MSHVPGFLCLQDLLAIPSVAELHEVWDFLSVNSQVIHYFQREKRSHLGFDFYTFFL
jgi:hypothetical protein